MNAVYAAISMVSRVRDRFSSVHQVVTKKQSLYYNKEIYSYDDAAGHIQRYTSKASNSSINMQRCS